MAKFVRVVFSLLCMVPAFASADVDLASTLSGAHNSSEGAQSQQSSSYQRSVEDSAKHFGVTTQEWTRYKSIMDGEGRFHWKDTDPRVVLGIYSKSASDRRRFAEMMARKEYELNKRFIEFNQDYLNAFERLYGNEPIMNLTKVAAYQNQFQSISLSNATKPKGLLSMGDRIVLFVSADCTSCDDYFRQLREVQELSVLDVYFVNGKDSEITRWAKDVGITKEEVSSGKITLNADSGMYAKYGRPGLPASFYFNNRDRSVSAFVPE